MPHRLIAAARTPWAPRHGALAAVHPEVLLRAAIVGALDQGGTRADALGLVLVACDTPVGAQAANIGRRVLDGLGAASVPALTLEGRGVADLGALGAVTGDRPVVVAAVDSTSIVAPGAALVRDYGRPTTLGRPDAAAFDDLARAAGVDRATLDATAAALRPGASGPHRGVVPVATSDRTTLDHDVAPDPLDLGAIEPLAGDAGLITAGHVAPLADGAAAVLVAPGAGRSYEPSLWSTPPTDLSGLVDAVRAAPGPVVLVDSVALAHVVAAAVAGVELDTTVASPLAMGSVPSADGLRALVDGFHLLPHAHAVLRRGRDGQLARVLTGASPTAASTLDPCSA